MSTAIRVHSLTLSGLGPKTLPAMEAHGKRQDQTSRARAVRDTPPLVYGTLDLRSAFDMHVEGARMNKALKRPVLHVVIQYPTEIELTPEREKWMVDEAVAFVDQTYGGRAVFATRLDRDESGRHTVDVFAAPRYRKVTKRGSQDWVSTTKHGRELCHRHRAEIERRHKGRFLDGPRQVGIALQSEWRAHLTAAARAVGLDLDLEPKREKQDRLPDRLEPEKYQAVQDAHRQADKIVRQARHAGQAYAAALDGIRAGRLLPSPRPGEWVRRARISPGRISARADRLLDRTLWTPDDWAELCRVSDAIAEARAEAIEIWKAAKAEARIITDEAETQRDQARRDLEQRQADLDRRSEADRRRATETAALATAVEAIGAELAVPEPTPGQWRRGGRWDEAHWDRLRPALAITWTDRLWTPLRDWAGRVVDALARIEADREAAQAARAEAEARRELVRELSDRLLGWVAMVADRLGVPAAEPAAIAAALEDLERQPDPDPADLPRPSPFDDGL